MKRILSFALALTILTACVSNEAETPKLTATGSQQVSTPQPEGIAIFAESITEFSGYIFDGSENLARWGMNNTEIHDGVVSVSGVFDWSSYMENLDANDPGSGAVAKFMFNPNSVFNISLQHGTWDTWGFREVGFGFDDGRLFSSVLEGNAEEGRTFPFQKRITLEPGIWYNTAFFVDPQGAFVITIWQEDEPDNQGTTSFLLPEADRNLDWRFITQVNRGEVKIDSVDFFNFSELKPQFTDTLASFVPTSTPTNVPIPQPTALPTAQPTSTPLPLPEVAGYLPEGASRLLSRGDIYDLAVSPDGQQIALGAQGGIYILDGNDFHDLDFIALDKVHYRVNSLEYTNDGEYLIAAATFTSGADDLILAYGTDGYKLEKSLAHLGYLPRITTHPEEPLVGVLIGGQIYTWNLNTSEWKNIFNPGPSGNFRDIKYSPNGNLLIANEARVVSIDKGGRIIQRFETQFDELVWRLDVSQDGSLIAAYSKNRMVVWNSETGEELLRDESLTLAYIPTFFPDLVFSEDSQHLYLGNTDGLIVWDLQSEDPGEIVPALIDERKIVPDLATVLPGNLLLNVAKDRTLSVFDLDPIEPVHVSMRYSPDPFVFELSPDGTSLAVGYAKGYGGNVVRLIDTSSGVGTYTSDHFSFTEYVNYLAFSPNGNFYHLDNRLPSMAGPINRTSDNEFVCWGLRAKFSQDETMYAYVFYNKLNIVSLKTCDQLHSFESELGEPMYGTSSNFDLIFEGGKDGMISVYNLEDQSLKMTIQGYPYQYDYRLIVSPDDRYLVQTSDRTWVWDLESGERIGQYADQFLGFAGGRLFTRAKDYVTEHDLPSGDTLDTVWLTHGDQVVVSPDGKLVAESGHVYTNPRGPVILVKSVETGRVLYTFRAHSNGTSPVRDVYLIFTPDSQGLISLAYDGVVLLWDVSHSTE